MRRVLELCLAPITLRIHCRQVCVDILFDVLDEKVAEVLHRTDVVAQVVADNHVRLRDDAMVFVDAETVEVGVQFLLFIARDMPTVVEVEATHHQRPCGSDNTNELTIAGQWRGL